MVGKSPIPHPQDWKVVSLAQIALKIGSGATPTGGEESYLREREKFALIRSQNVFDRRFDPSGLAFISDDQASRLQGVILQQNDLLLNITGDGATFSRTCAVPNDVLPACVNQHVAIVRINKTIADPGYVLSYLTHPAVKSYIESFNAGGSRRAITKGHIESFVLALPPISEQRAVASLLGALDDKIELNHQMNKTLEAMARLFFKDWFVDFGPTRAKAEGRQPYLAPELWALFPDALDDDDRPMGWELFHLDDLASQSKGSVSPANDPDRPFEHYSLPAFDNGQYPAYDLGWTIKSNKTPIPKGVVLLSKLNPEISRVWIPNDHGDIPQVASTEFLVFRPKQPAGRGLLYCLFRDPTFKLMLEGMVTGTSKSHQRISPTALLNRAVLYGSANTFEAFEQLIAPIITRFLANRMESRTLAQTRDLLLPKFMSGEIRLRDAEKLVEKVA